LRSSKTLEPLAITGHKVTGILHLKFPRLEKLTLGTDYDPCGVFLFIRHHPTLLECNVQSVFPIRLCTAVRLATGQCPESRFGQYSTGPVRSGWRQPLFGTRLGPSARQICILQETCNFTASVIRRPLGCDTARFKLSRLGRLRFQP